MGIAIIGGTGFSEYATNPQKISTDYGDVSVSDICLGGKTIKFLARHQALEVPHLVNYRANIQALKLLGIKSIYAVSACGRLGATVWPGHLGAVEDVDWDDLGGRETTFAEKGLLLHASMDRPCSTGLRERLQDAWQRHQCCVQQLYADAPDLRAGFHTDGTYYNINGPAFCTPAKETRIRCSVPNAKFIGQTLVPEIQLAREMSMAYAALAMCVDHSNYPGQKHVSHADGVMVAVKKTAQAARLLLDDAVRNTSDDFHDPVAHRAFSGSLHEGQTDLDLLRKNGRTNLASILEAELKRRAISIALQGQ